MALKFGERVGGRAQSAEMTRIDNKTKVYECQSKYFMNLEI